MTAEAASQVLITADGPLRVLQLNRPEALNALTLEMVRDMRAALDQFETAASVGYVVLMGAGTRGLCAGGDIRTLYHSALKNDSWAETFWAEEYALNARIASYPKPYIALMDGIVMGGGVGVSAHARYRIVTERTKIAMPEVGIGLIPDVGGTWLLSRSPGEAGTFLALTGMTVSGTDAIYARLADCLIAAERLPQLVAEIAKLPVKPDHAALTALLDAAREPAASGILKANASTIDQCFSAASVEDIMARLDAANTPFAAEALMQMRAKSPTALKVTLELLRRARSSRSLEDCLEHEFDAIMHAKAQPDGTEGIRAAVIDKDRDPKWKPARLADVTSASLAAFFRKQTGRKPIPFHVNR